jgi:hypothetical protein
VVIVRAFSALASAHPGQNLGQAAVRSGVNERGAGCVVFAAGNGDRPGIAFGVVVERAVGDAAIGDVSCCGHGGSSMLLPPRMGVLDKLAHRPRYACWTQSKRQIFVPYFPAGRFCPGKNRRHNYLHSYMVEVSWGCAVHHNPAAIEEDKYP